MRSEVGSRLVLSCSILLGIGYVATVIGNYPGLIY
jgi:hypothetical protein